MALIVGTAGWSIPVKDAGSFPEAGSALQRYAGRFAGVEVNSSFHRPHRASTWQRWAESVPDTFRFAVKLPKTITHQRKLVDCTEPLRQFLEETGVLGAKLAILLVQLPPKLAFDAPLADAFLTELGNASGARIVCEPRHPSWFDDDADALLERHRIARVAADPSVVPAAAVAGGWREISYWRLHGSPRMYRSSYDDGRLDGYATLIRKELEMARTAWCMFDNTASSAATRDALGLLERLAEPAAAPSAVR